MHEQLHTIIENLDAGVSAVTLDGDSIHYVFANDYYYAMLGYTKEQFLSEKPGKSFEIVHPDDRKKAAEVALKAQETGEPFELEYRAIRRDGSWFWIRCLGSSCRIDGYDYPVQLAVTRDITKEKEAQAEALSAYNQLRFLNETAHELLADADTDSGMKLVLGKVREYFDADRSYIFEVNEDGSILKNTYEICAAGVRSEIDSLRRVPIEDIPFWQSTMHENRYIFIDDISTLEGRRDTERKILEAQNIKSLIAVPLNRDGEVIGFIGVDNPKANSSHVGHLQAIGDYMAILLTRRDLNAKIENDHKMLRELMDDTPGGFVRMRLRSDGVTVPIYVNDGFCKLVDMTREEILEKYRESSMWGVHPEDMKIVIAAQNEMLTIGETRGAKYRLRTGTGAYTRVMIFGRRTKSGSGEVFLNIYYTDATLTEQEKQDISFREMLPVALKAMMISSDNISFVKDKDMKYICCSDGFAKIAELNNAEEISGRTDYELFPDDLAEQKRTEDMSIIRSGVPMLDHMAQLPAANGGTHYYSISKYPLIGASGNILGIYGTGRDVTEERENYARLKLLTNSIPGGIASYISTPDGIKITYFNDGFCKMLGYTREEYEIISKSGATTLVFAEDLPVIKEHISTLMNDDIPVDCSFRVRVKDGGYRWVSLRGSVAEKNDDFYTFNAVMYDITEQKSSAEAARIHEDEMQAAMSHLGKMLCEYDPAARTLILPEVSATRYNLPAVLHDFPESLLDGDVIDKEYHDVFSEFFKSIQRGDKSGTAEYREKWADGSIHWARAEFSPIFDSDGNPVKAIMAVEDTTQQHAQFELERNRPALGEENLIVHALFNLNTGETLEYAYRDGSEVPLSDRTALGYGDENLDTLMINESERAMYRELHDPKRLLQRFANGETELSLDYRRLLPNGEAVWVRNLLHMVRQPGGSDVLLFEYFYNIEEEKTMELLSNSLVSENYDYVARVSGNTGRYAVIANTGVQYGMPPKTGENFNEAIHDIAEKFIHPDDREMMIQNTCIEGIREKLKSQDRFQFICRLIRPNGEVRYKRLTEYYLDSERSILIIIREDISEFMENEMHKNEQLAGALAAAQQANQAKSQFLSRMSHELRTPMNAIIGLSALSATEINDAKAMADSIGKIGMSARYLLSLINDILEMSRIESGRMTLTEAPFDFGDFISQVNTIVLAQTEVKDIDYEVIAGSYTEPVYVGDATKLQEILVNVLGNAVKFTPSGGKITLTIEQLRFSKQSSTLRFTISDTGVGIDEEFLPHIFEPFSQESSHYTVTSAGTGLGLAITKNLVDMMNGHISVKSIKNVGSVFTIDVQLGVSEKSQQFLDSVSSLHLEKLRALVVDDDISVCKNTESILRVMGIEAQWATSGKQAVEMVSQKQKNNQYYDTVFIDWKMPEMNGIETAREIRKIVGPNTTIIIITAYDWRAFEEEAIEAGVNTFIEKPLFHSSIAKVFEKIYLKNNEDNEKETPLASYDFTGKRILLVEDHPLNVEVARKMLEKVGAEVIVANNGLEAIETFTTAEIGWFSAILMDIRMPVMDGLTATKSIRKLRKKGSRDIPIIAMTANAFDEDVELSLSAGMNAHLAKPIDPPTLFATLKRLMKD